MTEFFRDTLPNGLRVVTAEMPHLHSVEVACYLRVGGRDEDQRTAGISHFLEHILFRGTAEHPTSVELERAFEALGGTVNASTDAEITCYHSRLHPRHIEEGLGLFASMLRRPLIRDVEVERKVILEEALEDLNEQGEDISPDNLTSRLLWPGHPLSLPTIGTRHSISTLSREDLVRHHARYYSPRNLVIGIAGKVRREQVLDAVAAHFGNWEGAQVPSSAPVPLPAGDESPQAVWVRDSDSQVNLQLAFRLPGRHDPRNIPVRVLRRILSGGATSRLMLRLRETLGLTYNVEANLALFEDTGCLSVDVSLAPPNLLAGVKEILAVFEELRREPIGEEELQRVVRNYLFDLDFCQDHAEELANRYGWGEVVGYLRTIEADRREIAAVTPADLQAAAASLFLSSGLKAAVVGPFRKTDCSRLEKMLLEYGR